MRSGRVWWAVVWLLAGCGRGTPRTPEQVLNAPASLEEAAALMRSVDSDAAAHGWPREVARDVRARMTGRLMAAGVRQKEIEAWIASPVLTGSVTNRTEGER